MLFNSYSFIFLFLPITFFGMFLIGRYSHRLAALWLGLASLAFYAFWDFRFVFLLVASIAFNYGAGYWLGLCRAANGRRKPRALLIAAIAVNLAVLGYFKYTNFLIDAVNTLLGGHLPGVDIVLPLGISFFTFTQIAFLVDVYRGVAREYSFIHYLLFVTYFPHLIAGPVLHHKQMMPQFAAGATYRIVPQHVAIGLTIFVLGLAKKVLLADTLAEYASTVFDAARDGELLRFFEAWVGALAYTLQLYFDFSGYSDMAIGLSLLLNVRLPLNFDSPYKATSIIDFWRRWHMTLSTFLRDYLYFPLGGNRKGPIRRYANLMITMLLGGLWHGAGWTFIVWGGLHGLYLTVNHGWRGLKLRLGWDGEGPMRRLTAGGLTFLAVVIGWVFFRAESLASAQTMLAGMAGWHGVSLPASLEARWAPIAGLMPQLDVAFDGLLPATQAAGFDAFVVIAGGLLLVWFFPNVHQIARRYNPTWEDLVGKATPAGMPGEWIGVRCAWRFNVVYACALGVLFACCLLNLTGASEFLYFQF